MDDKSAQKVVALGVDANLQNCSMIIVPYISPWPWPIYHSIFLPGGSKPIGGNVEPLLALLVADIDSRRGRGFERSVEPKAHWSRQDCEEYRRLQ